jgi:hypothetical protein
MRKQKAANQPEVISRKYGQVTVVKDGITQLVTVTDCNGSNV